MSAILKQILVPPDNYCYIIYSASGKAAVVDPGMDDTQALYFIEEKNLNLLYIIATHHHMDHTYSIKHMKKVVPSASVVASRIDGERLDVPVDVTVEDNDSLDLDRFTLSFILTPGHTKGSICVLVDEEALLTGDTLFIGDCGRTDLPGGDPEEMYYSLHEKIMKLPGRLIVYPGHDYGDKPYDTLENQIRCNKTLRAKSYREFLAIP
ncbi:MAG: MBL fold metallo-hydrolase [Candidatus Thermoplasmatota archaeon]